MLRVKPQNKKKYIQREKKIIWIEDNLQQQLVPCSIDKIQTHPLLKLTICHQKSITIIPYNPNNSMPVGSHHTITIITQMIPYPIKNEKQNKK